MDTNDDPLCSICRAPRNGIDGFSADAEAVTIYANGFQCAECAIATAAYNKAEKAKLLPSAVGGERFAAMKAMLDQPETYYRLSPELLSKRLEEKIGRQLLNLDRQHPGFDAEGLRAACEWSAWKEGDNDGAPAMNLVIEGPKGVGKSRIMAWICWMICVDGGFEVAWITESNLFALVGDLGKPALREAAEEKLEALATVNHLFIDDLNLGSLTAARFSRLFDLFDRRYREGLPVVVTTNYSAEQLVGRVERFWTGQNIPSDEATTEAHRLLRRLYGTKDAPLAMVVECQESRVIVDFPDRGSGVEKAHAARSRVANGSSGKHRTGKGRA